MIVFCRAPQPQHAHRRAIASGAPPSGVEGSKQALSLGLMAQKKLQDVQFFDANEAFSSFSKDQQEQLLKDLLMIELSRIVLSNLASDGKASPSASASLTRLEQRLSTDPVWLMLSTTDAAPAVKINRWMIKTAHKLAKMLEVDIAQRLGEQSSPQPPRRQRQLGL